MRNADFDPAWPLLADAVEGPGAQVSEEGALAAGEDRGCPAAAMGGIEGADRIDAAVQRAQPSDPQPMLDCLVTEADRFELAPRNNSVLRPHQPPRLGWERSMG